MLATIVLSVARGFVMGAADIVPGVSGGTIALIFGIYDRLISSIRAGALALGNLATADLTDTRKWFARVDWTFILSLGAGILLAVASLATVLEKLLIDQAVMMSALFLGLVAGSIVITWQMIKKHSLSNLMIVATVGVGVFVVLGLRNGTTEEAVAQVVDPALWAFFLAGAIAICAMILPGISGSFLLVLMGMYGPVLGAVTSRDFASLGVFLIGAVIGLGLFSQILYKALSTHHDAVLAALIGLMAGSMRVLWPWPFGVDSTVLGVPDSYVAGSIAIAAVAFVAVIVVARFAQRLEVLDTSA
jgi:putative membrane protein